ncbi:uncharacterized protein H6S33_009877 [Morchella sextelata]|uniref:uncharacterized protein n=1 Tax=Morchella sextelata TaxID=1174677 RepID=UPI001D04E777|nr:uncharacterized protein H6S33_009877 [Morchella sextelata]KAH0602267.1 hypothetical protein H6S33_009877 [Morchella sextelata]
MHGGRGRTPGGPSFPNGQWPNQAAAGNLGTLQSQGSLAREIAIPQTFGGDQSRKPTGPRTGFRQENSGYHYSKGSVDRFENGPSNTGGYNNGNSGGYNNGNTRGYTNGNNGGYTNGNNGGYTNGSNGGYTNGSNGGYTNDSNGGYTNGNNGGYINGNNGGYINGNNGGYTSGRGTTARQQFATPSAKFPGSFRTDSSAHGSVGSPVDRDYQPGYSISGNKTMNSRSPGSGVSNSRQGRPFQTGSESLGYSLVGGDNHPPDNTARISPQDHNWTSDLNKRGEMNYQIDSRNKLQDRETFHPTANGTMALVNYTPPNRRIENNHAPTNNRYQPQHAEKRTLIEPSHLPAIKCGDVKNSHGGKYNSRLGSGLHTNQNLISKIRQPKDDPNDHQPGLLHYTAENSDSGSESSGRYTPELFQQADLSIRHSPKPEPYVDRNAVRLFWDNERETQKETNPDPWIDILSPGKNESSEKKAPAEKKAPTRNHPASTDTVFDDVKVFLPESITNKEGTRSEDPILAANLQKPGQFTKGNISVAEEKSGEKGFNPIPLPLANTSIATDADAIFTNTSTPYAICTSARTTDALTNNTGTTDTISASAGTTDTVSASAGTTGTTDAVYSNTDTTNTTPNNADTTDAVYNKTDTTDAVYNKTDTTDAVSYKNRNVKAKSSAPATVPESASDPIRAPVPARVSTSARILDNVPIPSLKWVEQNAKVTPSPYPRVAKENPKDEPSTTPRAGACWRNRVNDDDVDTWDFQGINKQWSDDEAIEKREARKTGKKNKYRIRKAHAARDLPDQDDNGGVPLGKFMGAEAVQSTKAESVPDEPLEAPKFDGPKSVMVRADRSHIGRYSDGAVTGIRKLSEDTLTTIFSYLADGLMPEDQMETKNVHIGNSFKFDTSFTTTRYRRLRAVLRSCHYWRHLGQQIVCKYVNLNKLPSFERFVRTISEDEELGNMVRAIKVNIHGGASYMAHDRSPSKQLAEMPKVSDLAQLFTRMMQSCPQLQVLSVNMHGAIMGFNLVFEKFPMMREIQIKDDKSKGIVAHNIWINLSRNYPNLENFRIFHCQENAATNFNNLKNSKIFQLKGGNEIILKALTMERCPEISDRSLAALCPKLKNLTTLVIVDCKLVTSGGSLSGFKTYS